MATMSDINADILIALRDVLRTPWLKEEHVVAWRSAPYQEEDEQEFCVIPLHRIGFWATVPRRVVPPQFKNLHCMSKETRLC